MTSNTYIYCFKSLKKVQKPLRYCILMVFSWLGRPSMGCGTSWTCPNGSPFVDSWLTIYIPQCQIHFPERYFGWTHDTTFGWIWSWYHQIWTGRRGDKPPRLHVDILQSLFKEFPQQKWSIPAQTGGPPPKLGSQSLILHITSSSIYVPSPHQGQWGIHPNHWALSPPCTVLSPHPSMELLM